ncbi:MAG: hypothetical protein ACEQR8_07090 [Cypionkella sp.]
MGFGRNSIGAAIAACCSMAAAPLAAADVAHVATSAPAVFSADAVAAQNHRRWYRRDRVDAGDVIGGLLVIGTIAAVASAASKASRNDRYRARDYRPDYPPRTFGASWQEGRGLDRAVDICAGAIERDARIASVDSAARTAAGWQVTGRLRTGAPFTCSIGPEGRIEAIDYGAGGATGAQWSDDRYAAARAAQDGVATQRPAYPGGPLGDEDTRPDAPDAPAFPG